MFEQFFGRPFWITLGALAAMFVAAILVFPFPTAAGVLLVILMGAVAVVSWKRIEFGLLIAFAELFANSHGHLISYEFEGFSFSLRMAIFVSVMAAWLLSVVTKRSRITTHDARLTMFLPLIGAVAIGFVIGFAQNEPMKVFKDGNAYLYLAYLLPILSVEWDAVRKRLLLQVFAASATWVVILTLGLLYVFTHVPEWMLGPTYAFIRDTRTGELTKMLGNIFRIFLQAQFSVVAMAYFFVPFLLARNVSRRVYWHIGLACTAILSVVLISLSRSFWVGLVAGDVALLALVAYDGWPGSKAVGKAIGTVLLSFGGAVLLLIGIVLFPLPYRVGRVGDLTGLFSERTTDLSDVAISSRWNLLSPLMEEVKARPLLGSGFGEEVTFKTDDPRARAIHPDGTWTTYALEWGWLEVWLKMGILAPVAFVVLFCAFLRGLRPYLRTDQSWIAISLMCCLVMLYATHMFSPYLNHPLGLGLLLFFVPFLKLKPPTTKREVVVATDARAVASAQASVAPCTSE